MAAVYRLAPLEAPAPLQTMDPLTRGDLFHQMQAAALRRLQGDRLLPLSTDTLPAAQQRLTAAIKEVHDREYDRLNPAIDRVWQDEIAAMTQDLRVWSRTRRGGQGMDADRFEFAFGLPEMDGPTPRTRGGVARRPLQCRRIARPDRRHEVENFFRVTISTRDRQKPPA